MPVVGLRDIHVALLSEDGTYEAPRKLAPAMTAEVTPNFEITTLYGDDQAVAVAEALGDIDVSIGITDLSSDDYAFLLGRKKNEDGVIEDSTDDVSPYVAIGWALPKENGAMRYYWYYKGKFTIPSESNTTKQGTTEFQTPTLSGKFMARDDKKWRARVDSDDSGVNNSVIANWFSEVYEPSATPTV